VYVRDRPKSDLSARFAASLAPRYKGPFKIAKLISKQVLLIQGTEPTPWRVHVQDIKVCHKKEEDSN